MKNIVVFVCFIICSVCLSQDYSLNTINPILQLNVNAVVRNYDTQIWLHNYNDMTIKEKNVITVFNQKVMEDLSFYVTYDNYETVKDYYAILYDESGKKIKTFKKKDFMDVSATGSNLYSDDRALLLNFTPTFYPFTLEFYYEKNTSSTAFIPAFFPYPYSNVSVENSSYTLYNEKQIPLLSKKVNMEDYDIVIDEDNEKFQYSIKNIRPILKEELSPSYKEIMPWVRLIPEKFQLKGETATVKNWKDFGLWQQESLLKDGDILDESTISKVSSLVQGVSDPKEKAKIIYQYMQGKTRYISVQIGIGGWQPFPAKEVDRLGYGDCKGLTNYTKALLKSQGIDSYYTIVDSGPNGLDIDENIVGLQGDHVILSVPFEDEMVFLECTSQDIPFNFLGTFTDNRKVLMITPTGGVFEKTHTYTPSENLQTTKVKAVLDDSFVLNGQLESKSYGLKYYESYFLENKDQKERDLYYKDKLSFHNSLSVDGISFKNVKEDTICFTEKFNFSSPSYITKAGDRLLLNPNLYSRVVDVPKKDTTRKFPLIIKRGYTYTDEIEIQLPENYTLNSLFEDSNVITKFGEYSASITVHGNTLLYKRKFIQFAGKWPKEQFNDYVSFMKQISKKDKSKIVLIKNQ